MEGGTPVRWFADRLTQQDLHRFQAKVGDPAYNTIWEALAILVALRLWRTSSHQGASFEIRSDNLPFLMAMLKGTSKDESLRLILRELSLDESLLVRKISLLTHIPGISNILPDHLSRLHAPSPHPIPSSLHAIPRDFPPLRIRSFYKSIAAPSLLSST